MDEKVIIETLILDIEKGNIKLDDLSIEWQEKVVNYGKDQ